MPSLEKIWGVRGYFEGAPFERTRLDRFEAQKLAEAYVGAEVFIADRVGYTRVYNEVKAHVERLEAKGQMREACARIRRDLNFCEAVYAK